MKNLVELIVKELVDEDTNVVVTKQLDDGEMLINIEVDDSQKGKVIGKNGKIINSIRTIAKACAIKEDVKVTIKI
ncbi:MAG: KH domain-containing protein [Tissierellia bacterium]|nr:KH domain-containing protein [Tissierellia bacterium]